MPVQVRVATLNLFNNSHGRWADREPLVHEQAAALDADVLTFQECDVLSDQLDRLVAALGAAYTFVAEPNPNPGSGKSLAIVTRLPVEARDTSVDLGAGDIAQGEASVGARGRPRFGAVDTPDAAARRHRHRSCLRRPPPAGVARHAVDYVFVTPAIDVVDCRVAIDRPAATDPRLFPSDHLGLVATLRLP